MNSLPQHTSDQERIDHLKAFSPIHLDTRDGDLVIHVHKDKIDISFQNETEDRVEIVLRGKQGPFLAPGGIAAPTNEA